MTGEDMCPFDRIDFLNKYYINNMTMIIGKTFCMGCDVYPAVVCAV